MRVGKNRVREVKENISDFVFRKRQDVGFNGTNNLVRQLEGTKVRNIIRRQDFLVEVKNQFNQNYGFSNYFRGLW